MKHSALHSAKETSGKCADRRHKAKHVETRGELTCPEPLSLKIRPKVEDDTLSSSPEKVFIHPLTFELTFDFSLAARGAGG